MEFPLDGRGGGSRFGRFIKTTAALFSNQSGASLVVTALALPVILGVAGLGFDVAIRYMESRQIQTVADNAALRAVVEMNHDPDRTAEKPARQRPCGGQMRAGPVSSKCWSRRSASSP